MSFNEEKFKDHINSCRDFNYYVGTKVYEVHDGLAVLKVEMRKELYNRWGSPHGGVIFTLADTTAGLAAMSAGERRVVTANAHINYIRRADPQGALTARARVVKAGKSLAFTDVEIFDSGETLVATGQFTMAYTDEKLPGIE